MTANRLVIQPEVLAANPIRFGVRSARLPTATPPPAFAEVLAARGGHVPTEPTPVLDQLRGAWPVRGEITSPFGPRNLLPGETEHIGIDIAVPFGTPVQATADGIVRFAGNDNSYGNRVEILHDDGTVTLYAHNEELLVTPGERVSKGTVIALAGSTGASTGPHVHYEIRRDGVPIDPWPLMTAEPVVNATSADIPYADLIASTAARYGVDPALVAAIIQAESGFDPAAISSAGAKGLMQLMDGTAAGLGVYDSFDPAANIDGGTRYIQQMLAQFGGDPVLALAAYNAGPGTVAAYGGVPPYAETEAYIANVLRAYQTFSVEI